MEKRNGCTAVANLSVIGMPETILPMRLIRFSAALLNEKVSLNWSVEENETGDHFVVQKSTYGTVYADAALIFINEIAGVDHYTYQETMPGAKMFYRLVVLNKDGTVKYSNAVLLKKEENTAQHVQLLQNPVTNTLRLQVQLAQAGTYSASVYSLNGGKVMTIQLSLAKGNNPISLPFAQGVRTGSYILELRGAQERYSVLFIKQ